jgi:hypothetical protein
MSDIVRGIGFGDWNVRVFDGVPRVSGTEVGRHLEYDLSKPSAFNQMVVTKWLKAGKLSDYDVKQVSASRLIGIACREVTEYWLTLDAALKVAMEVRTEAAQEVRTRVLEQLQNLKLRASLPGAAELTAPANDALGATPELALEKRAELFAKLVLSTIEEGLVAPMDQVLKPLEKLVDRVERLNGLYIDEDRRLELNYLARLVVRTRGKGSVSESWRATRESYNFRPGRTFATVRRDEFPAVFNSLSEQVTLANAERNEKDREKQVQLAKETRRVKREAARAKRRQSNVVPFGRRR